MYIEAKAIAEKIVDRMALQSTPTFRVALKWMEDFYEALNSGNVVDFAERGTPLFPGLPHIFSVGGAQLSHMSFGDVASPIHSKPGDVEDSAAIDRIVEIGDAARATSEGTDVTKQESETGMASEPAATVALQPTEYVPNTTKSTPNSTILHPMVRGSHFLCDEISTGLDSAATIDPSKALPTWCKTLGGSVIVALQRLTPEVVEQFDDILIRAYTNKTHEAISTGFTEHQFENAEDFQKAKSVANLARSKQKSEFDLAFVPSTLLLLNREKLIWLRDRRCCGRQAWQQIAISFQLRGVFCKQRARNFFSTTSYAIAETVVKIPVSLSMSFILGTFFYFMNGMAWTFKKYIVFFLALVCFQHAIGAYMTILCSLSPRITVSQVLVGISVIFFLLFSGNIILAHLIFITLNRLALHFIRWQWSAVYIVKPVYQVLKGRGETASSRHHGSLRARSHGAHGVNGCQQDDADGHDRRTQNE
ncbi:hypothetical protein PHYPSEUDO_011873 [Phytophthora pseudosyringae]|uniref:ABC-2 type transporter transmembrane domain-containing protein n=1 Tax=Phytophthora pseudosyringae TaxID=221518 RepID=A0A8T1V7P6_9STRA|nr:hypothetical protein PHYPSEUDO_011873 [Phytophthora pseudosyringae]